MFVVRLLASTPLLLRRLYLFAGSTPPCRVICVSSALLARLCPLLADGSLSELTTTALWAGCAVEKPIEGERCVGVVAPVGTLVDESVRPGARLYRPGDGLTGASPPRVSERSGIDREMEGVKLSTGLRKSPSSLETRGGPADERLEDPEVETVESDDEEG